MRVLKYASTVEEERLLLGPPQEDCSADRPFQNKGVQNVRRKVGKLVARTDVKWSRKREVLLTLELSDSSSSSPSLLVSSSDFFPLGTVLGRQGHLLGQGPGRGLKMKFPIKNKRALDHLVFLASCHGTTSAGVHGSS